MRRALRIGPDGVVDRLDLDAGGDTLSTLSRAVGGLIEVVGMWDGVELVCNEEGKLARLPLNPVGTALFEEVHGRGLDVIVGPVVLVGSPGDDGEEVGLTETDEVELARRIAAAAERAGLIPSDPVIGRRLAAFGYPFPAPERPPVPVPVDSPAVRIIAGLANGGGLGDRSLLVNPFLNRVGLDVVPVESAVAVAVVLAMTHQETPTIPAHDRRVVAAAMMSGVCQSIDGRDAVLLLAMRHGRRCDAVRATLSDGILFYVKAGHKAPAHMWAALGVLDIVTGTGASAVAIADLVDAQGDYGDRRSLVTLYRDYLMNTDADPATLRTVLSLVDGELVMSEAAVLGEIAAVLDWLGVDRGLILTEEELDRTPARA